MPLLNYTTQIDAEKTIGEINKILSTHGATSILSEYDADGNIFALSFRVNINGQYIGFKLPADWHPVLTILERDMKVPRRLETKEQAVRISWRIIKDWIEAQMALVETHMVSLEQVFLPYAITNDGQTVFEKVMNSSLLLSGGKDN